MKIKRKFKGLRKYLVRRNDVFGKNVSIILKMFVAADPPWTSSVVLFCWFQSTISAFYENKPGNKPWIYSRMLSVKYSDSRTCIKRQRINSSPSIKRLVTFDRLIQVLLYSAVLPSFTHQLGEPHFKRVCNRHRFRIYSSAYRCKDYYQAAYKAVMYCIQFSVEDDVTFAFVFAPCCITCCSALHIAWYGVVFC